MKLLKILNKASTATLHNPHGLTFWDSIILHQSLITKSKCKVQKLLSVVLNYLCDACMQ